MDAKVLEAAIERYPDIIAIVSHRLRHRQDAVEAIKQGAADFITKPFQFDALLTFSLGRRTAAPPDRKCYLRSQLEERYARTDWSATAPPCGGSFNCSDRGRHIEHGPDHGETGTGKELARVRSITAARDAPTGSSRSTAARFPRRCWRGAVRPRAWRFTGAVVNRQGRLEQAHKGTLFSTRSVR